MGFQACAKTCLAIAPAPRASLGLPSIANPFSGNRSVWLIGLKAPLNPVFAHFENAVRTQAGSLNRSVVLFFEPILR
jgi:hypothetical protein